MLITFLKLFFYSLFGFCAGALSVHFVYKKTLKQGKTELNNIRSIQKEIKSKIEKVENVVKLG